jgi:predicted transcriptional regulator
MNEIEPAKRASMKYEAHNRNLDGATISTIARELGISRPTVRILIDEAIAELAPARLELADSLRRHRIEQSMNDYEVATRFLDRAVGDLDDPKKEPDNVGVAQLLNVRQKSLEFMAKMERLLSTKTETEVKNDLNLTLNFDRAERQMTEVIEVPMRELPSGD